MPSKVNGLYAFQDRPVYCNSVSIRESEIGSSDSGREPPAEKFELRLIHYTRKPIPPDPIHVNYT